MARAPASRTELYERARALEGRTLSSLAEETGFTLGELGLRGKGKIGALLEHVLGATAGSTADFDFPALEVELKTVPVDESGRPRESTYVCTLQLLEADRAEWSTSWVRRKLSRVLFVPVIDIQRIGRSVLFEPNPEQDAALRSDFDEIIGAIGAGAIEGLTAHVGVCLQVRPKAAHGDVRTPSIGPEDRTIATVPRGFYLRARFVNEILTPKA